MKLEVTVNVFLHPGDEHQIRRIEESLAALIHQGVTIMADLTALQASVEKTTTVEQSAIVLLQGLKAQLDAAGTDPVALKALSDSLDTNDQALADAITANTPAA